MGMHCNCITKYARSECRSKYARGKYFAANSRAEFRNFASYDRDFSLATRRNAEIPYLVVFIKTLRIASFTPRVVFTRASVSRKEVFVVASLSEPLKQLQISNARET